MRSYAARKEVMCEEHNVTLPIFLLSLPDG